MGKGESMQEKKDAGTADSWLTAKGGGMGICIHSEAPAQEERR